MGTSLVLKDRESVAVHQQVNGDLFSVERQRIRGSSSTG